jgi:hypothetical protein
MNHTVSTADEMLDRIKYALRIPTDAALSRHLGVTPSVLSSWRSRNAIRYDLVIGKIANVSYHWMITGEGEIFCVPPIIDPTESEKIAKLEKMVTEQRDRLDRLTAPRVITRSCYT